MCLSNTVPSREQTKELEQEYKHVQSEQDNVIAKNEGELEDIKLRFADYNHIIYLSIYTYSTVDMKN